VLTRSSQTASESKEKEGTNERRKLKKFIEDYVKFIHNENNGRKVRGLEKVSDFFLLILILTLTTNNKFPLIS
jgi:hypothetical protein